MSTGESDATGLKLDYDMGFDKDGIFCEIFSGEIVMFSFRKSWEQFVSESIDKNCFDDGQIIVHEDFDGVGKLNDLSDSLRNASDNFDDMLKKKHICLFQSFVEGMTNENTSVSFTKYMKGEYDWLSM